METPSTGTQRDAQKDVCDLIQIMGQTLNMALLYGVNHKVTRSSLEITFTVTSKFIEFHKHIHFSIADGALLVNGETTSDSPLAASFATRLTGLNLFSFTIEPGFSQDECIALFSLFMTPPAKLDPAKSAAELLAGLGLTHIEAKSFSYRRISEDESDRGGGPAATGQEPPAAEPASDQPDLDNIMAFLKDDAQADLSRSAADIRHLAGDTEKLAELILRAVEIRSSEANLAASESLTDLIVGCIQKVTQPILKDPAAKTQKGRKHIKHSLLMLEKTLLERLRGLAGDQATHATEAMMDELVEDLDMDAIASKYMKSRRLAEKDSQKISRLIERASDDPEQLEELRDRLADQGLTPEGWQELRVKLAPAPNQGMGGTGSGDGVNEIKVLTLLLARIGETIQHPPATGAATEIHTLLTETSEHLATLADITEKKIETLQTLLTDEKTHPVLSREELIEILAEIAQEIMQPLTIITGTTAMIRSLRCGPFTEAQGELLSMIAESAERMVLLVTHLMHLAGNPETRQPDRTILDTAYRTSRQL
jgi:hypothetical protein